MERHDAGREVVRGASRRTICQEEIALHGSGDCFLSPHDDACRLFMFVHRVGIQFHMDMIWVKLSKVDLRFEVPVVDLAL